MMKIRIRRDLCCGAQLCIHIAPNVFRLDDLGYNDSDADDVPSGEEAKAKEAASACPEGAIDIEIDGHSAIK